MRYITFIISTLVFISPSLMAETTVRFAVFNVSMEANNYIAKGESASSSVLKTQLASGENPQIKNIAEIIQRVRPDVILLNEFDYLPVEHGIKAFNERYLKVSQSEQAPIDYPYYYVGTVNTGLPSPYDLDNNGKTSGFGADAYGFGLYEGHYGMALLSKYPIDFENINTLQTFKWKDMPGAQVPIIPSTNEPWYNEQEWQDLPLSSKSHWDIPIKVNNTTIHALGLHPTPPVFDGEEDRNGKRNHDEIRLIADYLDPNQGSYIYNDKGEKAGLAANTRFVVMGDLNAADIGDKHREGVIEQLTENPLVNNSIIPTSKGGDEASDEAYSKRYTAYWGARVDYALPSNYGFEVLDTGVFWPAKDDPLHRLVKDRQASSDHRLVWVELKIK